MWTFGSFLWRCTPLLFFVATIIYIFRYFSFADSAKRNSTNRYTIQPIRLSTYFLPFFLLRHIFLNPFFLRRRRRPFKLYWIVLLFRFYCFLNNANQTGVHFLELQYAHFLIYIRRAISTQKKTQTKSKKWKFFCVCVASTSSRRHHCHMYTYI